MNMQAVVTSLHFMQHALDCRKGGLGSSTMKR